MKVDWQGVEEEEDLRVLNKTPPPSQRATTTRATRPKALRRPTIRANFPKRPSSTTAMTTEVP
jgi:hypothetical protein